MARAGDYHRDQVCIEANLVQTTDDAILVETDNEKEVWIPRALIKEFEDNQDGTCSFECSEEVAVEKELV